jgi:lysophospholipase L1-like esterase
MQREVMLFSGLVCIFVLASMPKEVSITLQKSFFSPGAKPSIHNMEEFDSLINYLALGDSYTKGEGVNPDDSYPKQLEQRFHVDKIKVKKLSIIAETGWTTSDLLHALTNTATDSSYSLVSLLIGVNNQFQQLDIHIYKSEFEELVNKSIQLAGNRKERVFILSIPDYSVTPYANVLSSSHIQQEIDSYNAINKEIADKLDVTYFNITPISRKAEDDLNYLAPDELHPSAHMYGEWIDMIYPQVKELLKSNK